MGNNVFSKTLTGLTLVVTLLSCSQTKDIQSDNSARKNPDLEYSVDLKKFFHDRDSVERSKTHLITDGLLLKAIPPPKPKYMIIGGDTLEVDYIRPPPANARRMAYNAFIKNKALKVFPQCRPYIDYIIADCDKYRSIFPVSKEIAVGLLIQESNGDSLANSCMFARGGWQIMAGTAVDMGLKVYSDSNDSKLLQLEVEWINDVRLASKMWNSTIKNLKLNNFGAVKEYKMKYDSVIYVRDSLYAAFRIQLKNTNLKHAVDERLKIKESTDVAIHLLALNGRNSEYRFKGLQINNMHRSVVAYNAGFGAVMNYLGTPPFKETVLYENYIKINAEKINPHYWDDLQALEETEKSGKSMPMSKELSDYISKYVSAYSYVADK